MTSVWQKFFRKQDQQNHRCVAEYCPKCHQDHCSCVSCRKAASVGTRPRKYKPKKSKTETVPALHWRATSARVDDFEKALYYLRYAEFNFDVYVKTMRRARIYMTKPDMITLWNIAERTKHGAGSLKPFLVHMLTGGTSNNPGKLFKCDPMVAFAGFMVMSKNSWR